MSESYPPPIPCAYEAPASVEAATALLARYGRAARVLAGGTDLIIAIRDKGLRPACIVDVKRISELGAVTWEEGGGVSIGAAVPMTALLRSERFRRAYPMLCSAMETVGSYQLRTRATLAGNICNASPAADTVPPLITLGAAVAVTGPEGRREVALEHFFTGPGRHVLAPGELVTAVRLPAAAAGGTGVYLKQGRRQAMELAIVGVAAFRPAAAPGGPAPAVRIAIASVAPTPLRLHAAEAAVAAHGLTAPGIAAAAEAALAAVAPISDVRASAEYRRHLVRVLVRRVLQAITEGGAG